MSEAVGEKTVKGTVDSAGQGMDAAANGAAISVLQVLGSAAERHQTGALEEAEKGYYTVLAVEPENTDALQLLGVLRHQQGDSNEAIRLIKKALKRDPDSPQCHHNLIPGKHGRPRQPAVLEEREFPGIRSLGHGARRS